MRRYNDGGVGSAPAVIGYTDAFDEPRESGGFQPPPFGRSVRLKKAEIRFAGRPVQRDLMKNRLLEIGVYPRQESGRTGQQGAVETDAKVPCQRFLTENNVAVAGRFTAENRFFKRRETYVEERIALVRARSKDSPTIPG